MVRLGKRQFHHFGFLTRCHVKTAAVFDRVVKVPYSEWVARGWGLSGGTCLGLFVYWNRDVRIFICQRLLQIYLVQLSPCPGSCVWLEISPALLYQLAVAV